MSSDEDIFLESSLTPWSSQKSVGGAGNLTTPSSPINCEPEQLTPPTPTQSGHLASDLSPDVLTPSSFPYAVEKDILVDLPLLDVSSENQVTLIKVEFLNARGEKVYQTRASSDGDIIDIVNNLIRGNEPKYRQLAVAKLCKSERLLNKL